MKQFLYLNHIQPVMPACFPGKEPLSVACGEVLRVFSANSFRAISKCLLPGFCFRLGKFWGDALQQNGETQEDYEKNFQNILEAHQEEYIQHQEYYIATDSVEKLSAEFDADVAQMLRSLMLSTIVDSWGAYEVVVTQLVKNVIKPQGLSPKGMYGHLKAKFKEELNDANVDSILDDSRIRSLYLLRNLIVHNAAIVDAQFKAALQIEDGKFLSRFSNFNRLEEGDELPVDGRVVRIFATRAFRHGEKLISLVDRWVAKSIP
jgi:hypothetical protein